MIKIFRNTFLLLFSGIIAGALLLTFAFMLPLNESHPNAAQSITILDTEGWYPRLPLIESYSGFWGPVPNSAGVLDNFTDSIMIHTAVDTSEGNALYRAMNMYNSVFDIGYSYYWHGYVAILRPLLLFIDYGEIRVLNSLLQILLMAVLSCLIYQKKGFRFFLLSLTIYGLLMPMALAFSLQFSWVFYIGTIGSIIVVKYGEKLREKKRLIYLFLLLGMLSGYLDLLTYPLFTWGIPMLWWVLTSRDELMERERLQCIVGCGIFWILGYAGMWGGKWVLAQAILRKDVIGQAFNEVTYRAGMLENTDGSDQSRWASVIRNVRWFENIQTICVLGAWLVWGCLRTIRIRAEFRPKRCYSLGLVSLSSIAWYLVLNNHTYIHVWFTFRIFVITIAALLAMLILAVEEEPDRIKGRRTKLILPGVLLAASVILSFQDKVEWFVHNGYYESRQILLEKGDVLEQVFLPAFSGVNSMNLGLIAEGDGSGTYLLEISDGEQVVFHTQLSAEEVADSGFYEIPADITLKRSTPYRLLITAEGNNVQTYVTATKNGEAPLQELTRLALNGEELEGQMICGITYEKLPDKQRLLLNLYGWMGILGALYIVSLYIYQQRVTS